MSLTFDPPPTAADLVPDVADVLEDDDTGTLWRVDAIRPVTRGPNVGRRFYLQVTRITADLIPDGAERFATRRNRRPPR